VELRTRRFSNFRAEKGTRKEGEPYSRNLVRESGNVKQIAERDRGTYGQTDDRLYLKAKGGEILARGGKKARKTFFLSRDRLSAGSRSGGGMDNSV